MESTRPSTSPQQKGHRPNLVQFREKILDLVLTTSSSGTLNPIVADVHPIKLDPKFPGQEVLKSVLQFKAAAFSPNGHQVDYNLLAQDPAFIRYKTRIAPALRSFNPKTINTTVHKLAFWSNLYNALIIDAVITFNVKDTVTENLGLLKFFRKAAYNIGGQRISAEEIENGILRANQGHPYLPGPQFDKNDPRNDWSLSEIDPRIHFALNCASKSCPPIGSYNPDRVISQLDSAANNFVAQETVIFQERKVVQTSKIFQWYASDFGGREGTIDFLLKYLPDTAERSWLAESRQGVRLKFNAYDWKLNT